MSSFFEMKALESKLTSIESRLNWLAVYPLVGTLAALSKALLGVAQMVCSAVAAIFSLVSCCSFNKDLFLDGVRHFSHGMANTVSGLVLSIPVLQSVIILSIRCFSTDNRVFLYHYPKRESYSTI